MPSAAELLLYMLKPFCYHFLLILSTGLIGNFSPEIPITEYQLGDEYPGYSFSHQPKGNRIITLDSSDQWLTVKYPVAPICPLYLGVNFKSELPKMRLSRLELRIPGRWPSCSISYICIVSY